MRGLLTHQCFRKWLHSTPRTQICGEKGIYCDGMLIRSKVMGRYSQLVCYFWRYKNGPMIAINPIFFDKFVYEVLNEAIL